MKRSNQAVLLKWTQVARRIDELIKQNKYLTPEESLQLDRYEKRQIAVCINGFYDHYNRDRSVLGLNLDVRDIEKNLDDKNFVESVRQNMVELFSQIPKDDSPRYRYDKNAIESVTKFADGTYNLFPFSVYRRKHTIKREEPKIFEETNEEVGEAPESE